ncbi:hypothetical protein BpHYR1_008560 [Brachionus plicatilis]|uniref:Uncharacterized protein n=1 Tax=Brachionus plicatilis TaxID=10195 RepID=A0A3M7P5T4_BRAPC|nr:hypothetical protein BpHYR1_008560 [Brachionus plicatilis]
MIFFNKYLTKLYSVFNDSNRRNERLFNLLKYDNPIYLFKKKSFNEPLMSNKSHNIKEHHSAPLFLSGAEQVVGESASVIDLNK